MSVSETHSTGGGLQDRVALITGAASGIGRAMALLFARQGAAVAVVDLDEAGVQDLASAIQTAGGQARAVVADVTRARDCSAAVEETIDAFHHLDILCNNAGIIRRATVLETREEDWDRIMAVNIKSIYLMSRAAMPQMIETGGGTILNTASGWGLTGGPRAAAYCASKGAVVQLTRAMAIDHGPQGIRVNCLCPGDTDTPLFWQEADQLGQDTETFRQAAADRPLGRIGTADEIARAALYLVSEGASFVTGTALVVDGGGLAGG